MFEIRLCGLCLIGKIVSEQCTSIPKAALQKIWRWIEPIAQLLSGRACGIADVAERYVTEEDEDEENGVCFADFESPFVNYNTVHKTVML